MVAALNDIRRVKSDSVSFYESLPRDYDFSQTWIEGIRRMEMLVVFAKAELREEIELVLTKQGVQGFTEIADAHGLGSSGTRMGSAVHPKTSVILMSVVETEMRKRISEILKDYTQVCNCHISCVYWPVEVAL